MNIHVNTCSLTRAIIPQEKILWSGTAGWKTVLSILTVIAWLFSKNPVVIHISTNIL